eukprot:CAMPEP_0177777930 /NCGR_PEP_ID=MMETSP0491_2-20121128/15657_1 /TAXON_ID=63592 /ORGANISM="Tetraselmis chuii, Strain PLY429" /LENGTH=509 /DNA_ID=CAMNT_0019297117 /DNA_START=147 /DNA_END=1675 /DNA_ORIENTATION=+
MRTARLVVLVVVAVALGSLAAPEASTTETPRVVVVGGGLAGLSATLQLVADAGGEVQVVLLEKESKLGGNSAKASSGINALTPASGDSVDLYTNDTLVSGGGAQQDRASVQDESEDAVAFLASHGVQLGKLTQLGGHSAKRTHSNVAGPNVGSFIIRALSEAVKQLPQVNVVTSAKVKHLLVSGSKGEHRVAGVSYSTPAAGAESDDPASLPTDNHTLEADAVILATGGFGAERDMLRRYNSAVDGFATTNGQWATGDGMVMGHAIGGQLVDMDKIQIHPTGFVNPKDPQAGTKFLAPERLRGVGGILLNSFGKRFVNELGRRDYVTEVMLRQEGKTAWLLLGDVQAADFGEAALGFYAGKAGIATKGDSVEGIAAAIAVEADVLRTELDRYSSAVRSGQADEFGKTVFPNGAINPQGTMYVMKVTPVVHYTMGGLSIDQHARVLDTAGKAIPGLLAAGEVTGGVHGANRLGGNSLLDCTVFGRIAGSQAVQQLVDAGRLPSADDRAEL